MSAKRRETNTIKQVVKLSGVSVRALHFYDEIGLLKPAYYGNNGYRYYEKEQPAREKIAESNRRTKDWTKPDYEKVKKDYDELHRAFVDQLACGAKPNSDEVQKLVKRHFALVNHSSRISPHPRHCQHVSERSRNKAA